MKNLSLKVKQGHKWLMLLTTIMLLLASTGTTKAQDCIVYIPNRGQQETLPPSTCGQSIDYAPSETFPSHTPVKRIRMVWHFMCDDYGGGNFNDVDMSNASHSKQSDFWIRTLNMMNGKLTSLQTSTRTDPSHPTPTIPDSRIKFEVVNANIFYHHNTTEMNDPDSWGSHYTKYVTNNSLMTYKERALHVFFYPAVYGNGTSWASLGDNLMVLNGSWVTFSATSNAAVSGNPNPDAWKEVNGFTHELFHCLGLNHTNRTGGGTCNNIDNDGCDDTPVGGSLDPCPCWNGNASDGHACSNNLMTYNASMSALTRCQLGKVHYNLINNAYVNPYLIEDFCGNTQAENITITSGQNITWASTRYMKGDLIVKNGATLTVKCVLSFGYGSKLYVEEGGKLIIDGGRLTSVCSDQWNGVRVSGNSTLTQTGTNQGIVEMKNGAIIELALDGISLIGLQSNGYLDYKKTGGIVKATNSKFQNNKRDVEFMSYRSLSPTKNEYSNASFFENCDFITNNDVQFGTVSPNITMWEVNGVRISGCRFTEQRSGITPASNGRTGIYTIGASFIVNRLCGLTIPCSGAKCQFTNLKQGIESYNLSNPARTISVTEAEFSCYRGIGLSGINNGITTGNTFTIQQVSNPQYPNFYPYGIYYDLSTGFKVYDNVFNGNSVSGNIYNGSTLKGSAGLVIKRSDANNDMFRSNTFNNLITASQSIGFNRNTAGNLGLTFRCNTYNNNFDDFFVTAFATDPAPHNKAGIHPLQSAAVTGTPVGADNLFGNSSPILKYNIENLGSSFKYFHRDPATYPRTKPLKTTGPVTLSLTGGATACNFSIIGQGGTPFDFNGAINIINADKPGVVMKVNTWKNGIDGGNTPGLIQQVQTANLMNVTNVYNTIIGYAPWVSDDVLITVAGMNTPFTSAMIKNILVACPQSARSIDVQQTLDARTSPLSQQERDEINAVANTYTALDIFIEEWASLSAEYQQTVNDLADYYMNDEGDRIADLDNILRDGENKYHYYQLAELYYQRNMIVEGNNVVAIIPGTFALSALEAQQHNDFTSFYSTYNQWKQLEKDFTQLAPADIAWLQTFVDHNNIVSAKAIGLLKLNNASEYFGPVYVPEAPPADPGAPVASLSVTETKLAQLAMYPNPTTDKVNLSTVTELDNIILTDITGKTLLTIKNLPAGTHVLETAGLAPGVYFVTAETNNIRKIFKLIKQ